MTIGGIFGTVQELDDESVTVEVAPNVEIRFVKSAISRKLVYDDAYGEQLSGSLQQTANNLQTLVADVQGSFKNGNGMASDLDYVPMPGAVVERIQAGWKAQLKDASGKPVY